ncbi:HypC/HybG/HupF family hydrogenase formation chaperone [bacterium]|nr:HypC/HybG/HupF family hydrogenase formation chaperone [bacterium]
MCLAVPMKVIQLQEEFGVVESGGLALRIELALVPDVNVGNYVLVHAGYALAIVDEVEAHKMIEMLSDFAVGASCDT